jgi:exoribonuclease-2
MSEADSSMQVELDSGKRVKVKAANVLLKFEKPAPAELISSAQALARDIDLDLAWEFAPEQEFGFADLGARLLRRQRRHDQAGRGAVPPVRGAALLPPPRQGQLQEGARRHRQGRPARHRAQEADRRADRCLGRRAGGGSARAGARAALQDPVQARQERARIQGGGRSAPALAARAARPADRAGAIDSPYQFHWQRFLFENFPKGTGFPPLRRRAIKEALPLAAAQAFSIDDSATTEIDDALSVQGLGSGTVVFGIHIAAPGLAIAPDAPIDKVARERLSTVYMPGYKLTMLPDDVVQAYTLTEGATARRVAVRHARRSDAAVHGQRDRLERVPIVANLRHDQLDSVITEASLTGEAPADYPFAAELAFAFRLRAT